MILIRYILIITIGYLIIRAFINLWEKGRSSSEINEKDKRDKNSHKRVSKKTGEYTDYEEINK